MRKIILVSSLALMLLSTSAFAQRGEDDRRKASHVNTHKSKHTYSKRIDRRKTYSHARIKPHVSHRRPHRRPIVHRPMQILRPHHRPGYRLKRFNRRAAFPFILGGLTYHFLNGIFYRPYDQGYRVVSAPIGAIVNTLPHGRVSVVIGGRNYYMYNNIYYLWDGSRRGYRVVDVPRSDYIYDRPPQSYSVGTNHYRSGDIARTLPAGSTPVIIDGVRYYENEGIYFLPKKRNGRTVYKVVEVY